MIKTRAGYVILGGGVVIVLAVLAWQSGTFDRLLRTQIITNSATGACYKRSGGGQENQECTPNLTKNECEAAYGTYGAPLELPLALWLPGATCPKVPYNTLHGQSVASFGALTGPLACGDQGNVDNPTDDDVVASIEDECKNTVSARAAAGEACDPDQLAVAYVLPTVVAERVTEVVYTLPSIPLLPIPPGKVDLPLTQCLVQCSGIYLCIPKEQVLSPTTQTPQTPDETPTPDLAAESPEPEPTPSPYFESPATEPTASPFGDFGDPS